MMSVDSIKVTITTTDNKSFSFTGNGHTKIDQLREWTTEQHDKIGTQCNLFFQGRILKDGSSFSQCGIRNQTSVRATFQTKSIPQPPPSPSQMTAHIQTLMINFRTCMRSMGSTGTSRLDSLFKLLSETLREVSKDSAELANDQVAYLMAQDPKLHRTLLHKPQYITKALMQHPALVDALSEAIKRVGKSLASPGGQPSGAHPSAEGNLPVHYGMDYLMIDQQDDEEGEEGDIDVGMEDQRGRHPASNPLTSNQLSAAIASAINQMGAAAGAGTSGAAPAPPAGQRLINASDLLAAVSFVERGSTSEDPGPSAPPVASATSGADDPMREKLKALAELGFTDESAARRALEIANGNVEMAVDILLG